MHSHINFGYSWYWTYGHLLATADVHLPASLLARLRPQVAEAAGGDPRRRNPLVGRRLPGGPFWREHERTHAAAHRIVPAVRLRARSRHGRGHRPLDPHGSGSPAAH